VQRQPFGGWKASVVGAGLKAGGPGHVAQLGRWSDALDVPTNPAVWLTRACRDDARVRAAELALNHHPSGLVVESNVLRHRPIEHLTIRVGGGAPTHHASHVQGAASVAGVPVTLSTRDADADFVGQVAAGRLTGRIRLVGSSAGLREAARRRLRRVPLLDGPVLASARRELLTVVTEQSVSETHHRYGHIGHRTR